MSPSRIAWRMGGAAVAAVGALLLREGSIRSWQAPNAQSAQVRLSWSARPERVERCRRLSDTELAQLPPHMRLRLQCEGGFARYLLSVRVDSSVVANDTVRGGGLRHDRPIHLFEEVAVPIGPRRVQVEVVRLDSTTTDGDSARGPEPGDTLLGIRAGREADERKRRAAEAMPPRLVLDTTLTLSAGQVLLVVYDDQAKRLTAVTHR